MVDKDRLKISVILPVLNEAALLPDTLQSLAQSQDPYLEIIVADGGSGDGTVALARQYTNKVVAAPRGRGQQMNQGASQAEGDVFLFLHADSCLEAGGIEEIREGMRDERVVGGAFRLAIRSNRTALGFVSSAANLRTLLTRIPYGDQGIFVRRKVFERMGGYRDLPFMEDLDFCRRLKREGKILLLKKRVWTSPRRWEKEGALKVTLRNQVFVVLYYLGVSPKRLVRWYQVVR
jgi:rSAM/selenodomain-associated transferase 2